MGGLQTQPFHVANFSKGITDHYVTEDTRFSKELDNFIILPNGSLFTRPGSELDDTTNPQIPSGAQRIGTLINYNNSEKMFMHSASKIFYRNPSAYTTLQGPTGANDIFPTATVSNFASHTEWNRHLYLANDSFDAPKRIYKDNGGTYRLRNAGLPRLATAPTVASSGGAGANNYVYAFHYYYTYTIGDQTFEDFGYTTLVSLLLVNEPSASTVNITNIPVISNGVTDSYDTTVIKVYIYRTRTNGYTFYKVGEVTNGTTTFNDSMDDDVADDNLVLYTDGGVLDNDLPPLCKFIHVTNNIGYYANLKVGSQKFPNKYRASVPFDPDSVPGQFEDEVEDEITGFSSVQSIPIVLCKRHIYRVEGFFDELGRGSMTHTRISDTAGCISHQSAVQVEGGLVWAGNDGFYHTDGYKVQKISDHLNDSYRAIVDAMTSTSTKRIVGVFDEKERRIIWSYQNDTSATEVDACLVLDLRWGLSDQSTFYTMTGGTSFAPTSLVVFNRDLYRADKRGYVFHHDDTLTTDPKVDTLVTPSDWTTAAIIFDYVSNATNFGSNFLRKWVPRILVTCKNRTNFSIQIYGINDDGEVTRPLKQIRYRANLTWGDEEFIWGSDECVWNAQGMVEQWRRFPARNLRCSYMQIQLTNAYTLITKSDVLGTATVDGLANTAVLTDATSSWPSAAIDYYISFENDDYVIQYLITARTATTVTFQDVNNAAPTGVQKWEIYGYRKGELVNLVSYTTHFAPLSKTQSTYESSDATGNT